MILRRLLPLLVLAALLPFAGCEGSSGEAKGWSGGNGDGEEATLPVRVVEAEAGSIPETIRAQATLEAEDRAVVPARASQVVVEVLAEEGDEVEEGDLLARLDDDETRIALRRAQGQYEHQVREYERQAELEERDLISEEELARVENTLESAEIDRDEARVRVERHAIRAPVAGVVARNHLRRGEMVSQGAPAFEVVDLSSLLARVHVPEREIRRLGPDAAVRVTTDAYPDRTFPARVVRVAPVVDPETGTVVVTVHVSPEPRDAAPGARGARLRPGMFVTVRLVTRVHEGLVLVPKEAIDFSGSRPAVFVLDDEETSVDRRTVEVGLSTELKRAVEGIEAGERVVWEGLTGLEDGSAVEVVPETEEDDPAEAPEDAPDA